MNDIEQQAKEDALKTMPPSCPSVQNDAAHAQRTVETPEAEACSGRDPDKLHDRVRKDRAVEGGEVEVVCVVCRESKCDPGLRYPCACKFGYHVQCLHELLQSDPKWRKDCPGCRQIYVRLPLALRKQMNNVPQTLQVEGSLKSNRGEAPAEPMAADL